MSNVKTFLDSMIDYMYIFLFVAFLVIIGFLQLQNNKQTEKIAEVCEKAGVTCQVNTNMTFGFKSVTILK